MARASPDQLDRARMRSPRPRPSSGESACTEIDAAPAIALPPPISRAAQAERPSDEMAPMPSGTKNFEPRAASCWTSPCRDGRVPAEIAQRDRRQVGERDGGGGIGRPDGSGETVSEHRVERRRRPRSRRRCWTWPIQKARRRLGGAAAKKRPSRPPASATASTAGVLVAENGERVVASAAIVGGARKDVDEAAGGTGIGHGAFEPSDAHRAPNCVATAMPNLRGEHDCEHREHDSARTSRESLSSLGTVRSGSGGVALRTIVGRRPAERAAPQRIAVSIARRHACPTLSNSTRPLRFRRLRAEEAKACAARRKTVAPRPPRSPLCAWRASRPLLTKDAMLRRVGSSVRHRVGAGPPSATAHRCR